MDGLTIAEAAQTTGWTARMLRYIESIGLVEASRSDAGYRLYGPAELQRLRTLRELLGAHNIGLGEVGFARRMLSDGSLRTAIERWLSDTARRPDDVAPAEWLRFEQQKHERLLAGAPIATGPTRTAPIETGPTRNAPITTARRTR